MCVALSSVVCRALSARAVGGPGRVLGPLIVSMRTVAPLGSGATDGMQIVEVDHELFYVVEFVLFAVVDVVSNCHYLRV